MNPRGFGFVAFAQREGDIFVGPQGIGGAMHGDTVQLRIIAKTDRGLEGIVSCVLKRRSPRIAGTLRYTRAHVWLEPDDSRIRGPIVVQGRPAAADGQAAVVTITRFPEIVEENPEGRLEAILGNPGDPQVEIAKVLLREGIEEAHSDEAIEEARRYGDEVAEDALSGRVDLTHLPLPTIDPEDARDHDDAVWAIREEDGSFRAWIAIADVSHYVRPETELDEEAKQRANSIYLPDRAIPMLPRELSSNLCSLLPGVVRLCMCVEVELDPTGAVRDSRIVEGFMRSQAKLTYANVARALGLSSDAERHEQAEQIRDDLHVLWDLSRLLRARRIARGALDFELPEPKVVLDPEDGAPLDVQKRAHDPGVAKAYQLIEELMLLANETVAQFLVQRDVPTIFRVHGAPDQEKLARFVAMCSALDVKFELDDAVDPKRLSAFLKRLAPHPQKSVLHMLLLRAMKQAVYDVTNIGHFGLASKAYLHFTSPIRRYPDLVVHRAVKAVLQSRASINRTEKASALMGSAAAIASERERQAATIEREVVDLYRALFMQSKVGEKLEGTVTGIVGTGVFAAIDSPFVDVLVRMESLGQDSYEIADDGLSVVARRSGDRITIGERMMVEIEEVSIVRRTVYAKRCVVETERHRKVSKPEQPAGRRRGGATGGARSKPGRHKPKMDKGKPARKNGRKR